MKTLFETSRINGMELSNRFVRSATWEGMATAEGAVTPRLIETMTRLARGGVGLIVSSHTYVSPEGQATPWQLGIYKDELIPGLKKIAEAVHECGGRIVLQLAHAGAFAVESLRDHPPLAVSNYEAGRVSPKGISLQDITELVAAFRGRRRRAKAQALTAWSFMPLRYLLSQFFLALYNRRKDAYGGSTSNRARIGLEILSAVRESVVVTSVLMK